jgi:hypothetical protein
MRIGRFFCLTSVSILLLGACSPAVFSQSASDCFECHGDRDLTMERGGIEVSLYVSKVAFSSSIHADFECVGCHEEYDPYDLPHGSSTTPIACVTCHSEEEFENYENSVHGLANVNGILEGGCTECHPRNGMSTPWRPAHGVMTTFTKSSWSRITEGP